MECATRRGNAKAITRQVYVFFSPQKKEVEERVPPQVSEFFNFFFNTSSSPPRLSRGRLARQDCFGFFSFSSRGAHTHHAHTRTLTRGGIQA